MILLVPQPDDMIIRDVIMERTGITNVCQQ